MKAKNFMLALVATVTMAISGASAQVINPAEIRAYYAEFDDFMDRNRPVDVGFEIAPMKNHAYVDGTIKAQKIEHAEDVLYMILEDFIATKSYLENIHFSDVIVDWELLKVIDEVYPNVSLQKYVSAMVYADMIGKEAFVTSDFYNALLRKDAYPEKSMVFEGMDDMQKRKVWVLMALWKENVDTAEMSIAQLKFPNGYQQISLKTLFNRKGEYKFTPKHAEFLLGKMNE